MPLVISIQNQQSDKCTVAGVVTDVRNPFGKRFQEVVSKHNYQCKHDSFLASIIVINKDDLINFVGKLIDNK